MTEPEIKSLAAYAVRQGRKDKADFAHRFDTGMQIVAFAKELVAEDPLAKVYLPMFPEFFLLYRQPGTRTRRRKQ